MVQAARSALSVYVHLPWCVRKCPYCDFNSHTAGDPQQRDEYLRALAHDIEQDARLADGREIDTVFIGGGTPSVFSPAQIGVLMACLDDHLNISAGAEVTMEANPGAVERGSLAGYRAAGINRLSIGAQSFDDGMLTRLGRVHGRDDIHSTVREAGQSGFDNLNLDVMYALPGQSVEGAIADVEAAIALEPTHLSHYQLTLEPNTVFAARPPPGLPDSDTGFAMQEACASVLNEAGFDQYEVSAYARPGHECRHNLNYWSYGDYLGLGAGAHGLVTLSDGQRARTEKPANPRQYVEAMSRPNRGDSLRAVTEDDAVFEFMLNVLRLSRGFDLRSFESRTGLPASRLRAKLDDARAKGLMLENGDHIWRPTEQGFRFLNDLQALFLP